ncbi:sensor histidine kinase [Saccharopolyspora sp. WRP15-2]|uniref:Oxygen sensor histidine kinase NreB n=1 Tax=Saccharopolyspora oryzae TaxID=2997343 RepID=A0ABT4V0N1_9PSEU|nr:sensor histidine kinase [Saccharopolyspora oryzae]MDA3627529.1 sensor histidine kinase [Saccharopolyspora oryzae]
MPERQEWYVSWGPYVLLGLATLISLLTEVQVMRNGRPELLVALALVALVLQLCWAKIRRVVSTPGAASQAYYAVRTVLAFVLTYLNPFFAIYAILGYFDSGAWLRPRAIKAGLLVNALTMAGSQSGGLPPSSLMQWTAFGGLFVLNTGLLLLFVRLDAEKEENARAKAATIAELEQANARLKQAHEENAGLQAQLLEQAREAGISDERRRLAAEIHDTIAQSLAGIVTQLQAAVDSEDPAEGRRHVERAADLARHGLGEARRSVQDLGPSALEHDALPVALRKVVEEWEAGSGVRAEFAVTGEVEPLHGEIEATLLRIAQESLANAGRHAQARRVGVTLSYMDDEVSVDVRDDGRGFDPGRVTSSSTSGFGLGGMRARVERVAGAFEVESEPGLGTAVSARVPLVRHV